jgi:hypothetical protein
MLGDLVDERAQRRGKAGVLECGTTLGVRGRAVSAKMRSTSALRA